MLLPAILLNAVGESNSEAGQAVVCNGVCYSPMPTNFGTVPGRDDAPAAPKVGADSANLYYPKKDPEIIRSHITSPNFKRQTARRQVVAAPEAEPVAPPSPTAQLIAAYSSQVGLRVGQCKG